MLTKRVTPEYIREDRAELPKTSRLNIEGAVSAIEEKKEIIPEVNDVSILQKELQSANRYISKLLYDNEKLSGLYLSCQERFERYRVKVRRSRYKYQGFRKKSFSNYRGKRYRK